MRWTLCPLSSWQTWKSKVENVLPPPRKTSFIPTPASTSPQCLPPTERTGPRLLPLARAVVLVALQPNPQATVLAAALRPLLQALPTPSLQQVTALLLRLPLRLLLLSHLRSNRTPTRRDARLPPLLQLLLARSSNRSLHPPQRHQRPLVTPLAPPTPRATAHRPAHLALRMALSSASAPIPSAFVTMAAPSAGLWLRVPSARTVSSQVQTDSAATSTVPTSTRRAPSGGGYRYETCMKKWRFDFTFAAMNLFFQQIDCFSFEKQ
jgi:hypothetical protein